MGTTRDKAYPLSENLRVRRAQLALKGAEVADAVGIDRQTLANFESGNFVLINPDVLLKLAQVLKTTPNDLLGVPPGDGSPAPEEPATLVGAA
jgi:transcriptional regulator with XRE-family HTH domain